MGSNCLQVIDRWIGISLEANRWTTHVANRLRIVDLFGNNGPLPFHPLRKDFCRLKQ